jgi:arylsulfatase A-like enzyme
MTIHSITSALGIRSHGRRDHFVATIVCQADCDASLRLGPLWAQASTAPSRLYKCFPSEGGILVPAIVKPANGTFPHHWTPGGVNRSFSTCMDLAPTFLDLAGIALPAAPSPAPGSRDCDDCNGAPVVSSKVIHRGKAVHGMKGFSWANYFGRNVRADNLVENGKPLSGEWAIYPSDRAVGWELHAQAALRKGEYKIVFLRNTHGGKAVMDDGDDTSGWELFNVSKDPGETVDLSDKEPEKRKELLRHWDEYVTECGLVWGPNALDAGLSKEEAPHLHDVDLELQKTWLQVPGGQRPNL